MFVIDTSVIVDTFLMEAHAKALRDLLAQHELHVPDHAYAEVLCALRRLERNDDITSIYAEHCVTALEKMGLVSHSLRPLIQEAWLLRHNITLYDAPFVVLAGELDCALLTHDDKLGRAARDHVQIRRLMPNAP